MVLDMFWKKGFDAGKKGFTEKKRVLLWVCSGRK
jgi:hypothetical protein